MPTIYIDNEPYTIEEEGKNLLEACLTLGFDLPYFCWHPAMHSVGACRQCAVKQFKDENDTRGRIVMACMTPAKDGTRISVSDPEAVEFRRSITEWLMVNHPHDCPVCDEGGECHLQDMTVMTGQVYRRSRFKKRTFRNQDLGPFVTHEMNRCIECYRCVRFYRDYAGGHDFDVFAWHDHVYFGRFKDGALESEFSGNLVEICPTGVLTDKTLQQHYTRKWDLQTAPSVCVHCGLGCNIIPGERYGELRRIRNRYHGQVNGYFLCDRGRYGYEFVNSEQRVTTTMMRVEGETPVAVPKAEALDHLTGLLRKGNIIGIGSPRASLESNFALQALVGKDNFYHGVSRQEHQLVRTMLEILRTGPARSPSQQDTAKADAVFILGEDVNNTAPMQALALRQAAFRGPRESLLPLLKIERFDDLPAREAIQSERSPFYIATTLKTRLDDVATETFRAAPDDLARLGVAVAHAIDSTAPAVPDLSQDMQTLAGQIVGDLLAAKRPLIVSGYGAGSMAVIRAAANIARALRKVGNTGDLCFAAPECNSLGLAMMDGGNSIDALEALQEGKAETVIVLENDLYQRVEAATADAIFAHAGHIIVLDHLMNATVQKAEVVLPASTFAEADGTMINNEGRAQRFFRVFVPKGEIQESWRWLGKMMPLARKNPSNPWTKLDDVLAAMAEAIPAFAQVPEVAPRADYRLVGQPVPRQPHRYSGRTAMTANVDIHEPPPPPDVDAPLSFSLEGYREQSPSPLIPRFWAPGWNSVQSVNKFQSEVGGPLRGGDPGLRLIEPSTSRAMTYYAEIPAAFTRRPGEFFVVPAYHVFGSEELSRSAPGIAGLAPEPYLAMNADDAELLQVVEGQRVVLTVAERQYEVAVRISAEIPNGVVALPVGLPATRGAVLPAWGTLLSGDAEGRQ